MTSDVITTKRGRAAGLKINTFKSRWSVFEEHVRLWMVGALASSDLFSVFAALYLASQIRQTPGIVSDPSYIQVFSLFVIMLVILFARRGLYPGVGLNYVDELGLIISGTTYTFLVMIAITFVFKTTSYYSRIILSITWILSMGFIPFSRYMVRRLLIHLQLWGEPVVIIGDPQKVHALVEHFRINMQLGLRPVAVLGDEQCAGCKINFHPPDAFCTILAQAHNLSLKTALVVISDLNQIDELVGRFRTVFHRVILIKDKNGNHALNGLESLDFSSVLGLQVKNNLLNPWSQAVKRLIDLIVSFLGMIFLIPFLGLIALWIWFDSPGSIFYRQLRLGRDGQPFFLLKFRTMHENADQILADSLSKEPALQAEWEYFQKLRNDPRITRVGKFLRRFSLDELPQLWNIARAEMSLVGPRPMMLDQRDLYGEMFENYIRVAPGMTGLWQVSGRNHTTFNQRAEFDNEYIQRWSIWLDVFILAKTIKVVLGQKGAY